MKSFSLIAIAVLGLFFAHHPVAAAETNSATADLQQLISKIQDKLELGKSKESDFPEELKQFDVLAAKYKGEKTDEVARIPFMKAMVYLQVFNDSQKGVEIVKQVKREFPDTKQAQQADNIIEMVQKQQEADALRRSLVEGARFPDFNEKDMDGKPLSVANYKGKIVLIDFWATWCGPCRVELPSVIKTYQKHHADGFEIIGVSLDDSEQKLKSFLKDREMPWPQYFDGKGWGNKLAGKYGINSIPATFLLDGEGKIIAKDLRGEALEEAISKALAKK